MLLLTCFTVTREATVLALSLYTKVGLTVVLGIPILVVYVFAITLLDPASFCHSSTGSITGSTFLLLYFLAVVLFVLFLVVTWHV
jgi:hypothetical protein